MPQTVITAELLQAIYAAFNTRFLSGMQRGRIVVPTQDSMAKYLVKFNEIAMNVPSTGESENHLWLMQIPGFIEWVGDRIVKTLNVSGLRVVNRDFAETIKLPRNKVEDGQYGQYSILAEAMGAEGADDAFWLDLILDALMGDDVWGGDGLPFFSADRKLGNYAINNVIDAAITQARIKTAVETMLSYKGENGLPLNVVPYMILTGTSAFWSAKKYLENQAIYDSDSGKAVDNETRGIATARWHSRLPANAWYLLGVKGSYMPLCAQRRKEASALISLVNPTDPNVFFQKEYIYGTDLRGEGFRGLPFLVIRGSDGNPPAAQGPKGKKGDDK